MNVTVDQDSMANVSITVKPSILDIAGNPLVEAVDRVRLSTLNPRHDY